MIRDSHASVLRCRYRGKWDIFNRGYCDADIETRISRGVSRLRVFINRLVMDWMLDAR